MSNFANKSIPSLTKADLARAVADKLDLTRAKAMEGVEEVFAAISKQLAKGGNCEFRGFGVFITVERAGRIGRNPRKNNEERYDIPPHHAVRFKAGRELKKAMNNGGIKCPRIDK